MVEARVRLPARLCLTSLKTLRSRRIKQVFSSHGCQTGLFWPLATRGDAVASWGRGPYAHRGEWLANKTSAPLFRLEDPFLRSLHPGRKGEAPLGVIVDRTGIYYDSTRPSDLESMLSSFHFSSSELERARILIERLRYAHLSKYSANDPGLMPKQEGFVLIIDQTRNDASIRFAGANAERFSEMLAIAKAENPNADILIKTHPEKLSGHRSGHFSEADCDRRTKLLSGPYSPWVLCEKAMRVYTVSSQFGFEAILAGHRPILFGQPFYAGWGLSEDRYGAPKRRGKTRSAEELAAAALIRYPLWYDPFRGEPASVETIIDILEAQARAWREDRFGWDGIGMRLWKRAHLNRFMGQTKAIRFFEEPEQRTKAKTEPEHKRRRPIIWGTKHYQHQEAYRLEDGFLRSRGLGAALVPPLSLVLDDLGIYYDASRASRLEALINESNILTHWQRTRAKNLLEQVLELRLSKYNLETEPTDLPDGKRILIAGQVEDDASIRYGAEEIRSNSELLKAANAARPNAKLIFKVHPDVAAGLRPGKLEPDIEALADVVLEKGNPAQLLEEVDEVWTITSLIGFEALLRGVPVVTAGRPFYSGWGLTKDLAPQPKRRHMKPDLIALVHQALIAYPRYFDPVNNQACPPEIAIERLKDMRIPPQSTYLRLLSKLQGALASHAWLWR